MKVLKSEEICILKFKNMDSLGFLKHCFTGRAGGYSIAPYESLNMGMNTGDDPDTVRKNYGKVAEVIFGSCLEELVLSNQVHKTDIAVVGREDMGNGIIKDQKYREIDGLVTDVPGPVLSTVYADCTPLFFADRERRVVGVAHAGWKGTVGKIGQKMIEIMKSEFGSKAENILVGIGPTIGPCCYRVKSDVADRFFENFSNTSSFLTLEGEGSYKLDLWNANLKVIEEAGVPIQNIELDSHCTCCNPDLFYSYRRDDGTTGRMAAMIKLEY